MGSSSDTKPEQRHARWLGPFGGTDSFAINESGRCRCQHRPLDQVVSVALVCEAQKVGRPFPDHDADGIWIARNQCRHN
ncbi:hypothetical protein RHECNPAF_1330071 [Rhizobium etli CNPAF512]|nr:hypothetical protein RHECNPAF_1330071 [Rhizobium etli CNPAF512]